MSRFIKLAPTTIKSATTALTPIKRPAPITTSIITNRSINTTESKSTEIAHRPDISDGYTEGHGSAFQAAAEGVVKGGLMGGFALWFSDFAMNEHVQWRWKKELEEEIATVEKVKKDAEAEAKGEKGFAKE